MAKIDRNHPLRQLMDTAALGQAPTREEVEPIAGDPEHWTDRALDARGQWIGNVLRAGQRVADTKQAGDNGAARAYGEQYAALLGDQLPDDISYADRTRYDGMTPAELADEIPR